MRNGTAYLLPPLVPLTDATASGSWPTPMSNDWKGPNFSGFRDGFGQRSFNGGGDVADANKPRLEGRPAQSCSNVPTNGLLGRVVHQWRTPQARDGIPRWPVIRQEKTDGGRVFGGLGRSDWWRVEPKLGFGPDGLCAGLDGGRLNADAEKERPATDMPSLRNDAEPQADQWQAGGSQRILRRIYCNRSCMAAAFVKDTPSKSALCKRVTKYRGSCCEVCGATMKLHAHHIDGQVERLAAEYPDLMRELSHFAPPPCATCWQDGSWEMV